MSCDGEDYFDDSCFENSDEEDFNNYLDSDSDEDLCVADYSVLSGKDVRSRVDEDISEISALLSVPAYAARVLLCKFGWDVSKVHEEWFSAEEKTRKSCGLTILASDDCNFSMDSGKGEFFCGICLELYDRNEKNHGFVEAVCGHVFCETCWKTYIRISITDGPGSLSLMCPQPSCKVSIANMVDALACDEDKARYENFVLRSYIESRKSIKWCPFPGCEYAVECMGSSSNLNVTCKCEHDFCWNCVEETHTPADCDLVAKWALKNSSEAENTKWLLTNTKPCPKCHKSIEKNKGCMHMSCPPPCKYEFCWLCLRGWSEHGESTGGYYACNRYAEEKKEGKFDEEEKIREMAKTHLVKYTHYFERWIGNHTSRAKALQNLKDFKEKHMKKLGDMYQMTDSQLDFTIKAQNQIVEGRRVLKWSYAFGYYLPEDEPGKKDFFEYLQGDLESSLEKLHDLVENELAKYIQEAESKLESDEKDLNVQRFDFNSVYNHTRDSAHLSEFISFMGKVVHLTTVTGNYFDNLVTAIANDLTEYS